MGQTGGRSYRKAVSVPRLNLSNIRFPHDTVWRDPHGTSWRATVVGLLVLLLVVEVEVAVVVEQFVQKGIMEMDLRVHLILEGEQVTVGVKDVGKELLPAAPAS